jgi:hypothetical protein
MHKKPSEGFPLYLVAFQDRHPISFLMTSGSAYDNHTSERNCGSANDGVTNPIPS